MSLVNSFPGGNGGSEITVDSALDGTSENPVQNKVIKGVLDTTYKTTDGSVSGVFQDNDYFPYLSPGYTPPQKRIKGEHIKATLKTYFDTLYSTIKTSKAAAQGGTDLSLVTTGEKYAWNNPSSVPIVANQFDKANIYSTTEKIVGCWTDGRPLYQKTFVGDFPSNTTPLDITTGITNLKQIVSADGYFGNHENNKTSSLLPFVYNNITSVCGFYVVADGSKITLYTQEARPGNKYFITLRYTKTTDAANSFNYADENDYSTTEHIVGTWIDGKPVYQKTVICGKLPDNSVSRTNHGISNLGLVIWIMGAIKNDTNSGGIVVPGYNQAGLSDQIRLAYNETQIVIGTNVKYSTNNYANNDVYVTLKYTKTTD